MKAEILKYALGGIVTAALFCACNSSKDAERMPEDHETVMNTSTTNTTPLAHDTMRNDSIRYPQPGMPDTNHLPPHKGRQ